MSASASGLPWRWPSVPTLASLWGWALLSASLYGRRWPVGLAVLVRGPLLLEGGELGLLGRRFCLLKPVDGGLGRLDITAQSLELGR